MGSMYSRSNAIECGVERTARNNGTWFSRGAPFRLFDGLVYVHVCDECLPSKGACKGCIFEFGVKGLVIQQTRNRNRYCSSCDTFGVSIFGTVVYMRSGIVSLLRYAELTPAVLGVSSYLARSRGKRCQTTHMCVDVDG